MKRIEMWETSDGGIHKTKEGATRCETKLKVIGEVAKFLKKELEASPGHSISSHKDMLIMHWEQLRKWFGAGGPANNDTQKMIFALCIGGLDTEGIAHKQWFLEEILKLVVEDIEETHSRYEWMKGEEPPTPPGGPSV